MHMQLITLDTRECRNAIVVWGIMDADCGITEALRHCEQSLSCTLQRFLDAIKVSLEDDMSGEVRACLLAALKEGQSIAFGMWLKAYLISQGAYR